MLSAMHMREVSEPCSKGSCSVGKRPGVGGEEGGVGGGTGAQVSAQQV